MKSFASLVVEKRAEKNAPPHEHAAAVDAIIDLMKAHPKETQKKRGYWDALTKGKSFGDVMAILKAAKDLPAKYTKGGYICNRLKEVRG